jgi:Tol biopolymer transport system component
VKKILMDVMNKNCKVHHKTLHSVSKETISLCEKINKQLNGDHNTVNENNTTNNITYNIIGLGASFNKVKSLMVLQNQDLATLDTHRKKVIKEALNVDENVDEIEV